MSDPIKRWIKGLLARAGWAVYRPARWKTVRIDTPLGMVDADRVRAHVLRRGAVTLVIDVGANRGDYGARLRERGYSGRLVSLEPGSAAFEQLAGRAKADPGWEVERVALGSREGEMSLHLAGGAGEASSLLPMLPLHYETAPGSRPVKDETVRVTTLSRWLESRRIEDRAIYLKLDVQGCEMEVLRGCAPADLRRIAAVEVELSHVPLYEGQALIDEVVGFLYREGFRIVALEPVWVAPETAVCLQSDAIFARHGVFSGDRT